MPTQGQIALLLVSVAFFAAGGLFSFARLRWNTNTVRLSGKSCIYFGLLGAIGVLVWHSFTRSSWIPIGDNFDALIWLGLLLAIFVLYVQGTRPLAALEWFLIPVVVGLLVCAAVFGRTESHPYVGRAWTYVHLLTSFAGAAAFAV